MQIKKAFKIALIFVLFICSFIIIKENTISVEAAPLLIENKVNLTQDTMEGKNNHGTIYLIEGEEDVDLDDLLEVVFVGGNKYQKNDSETLHGVGSNKNVEYTSLNTDWPAGETADKILIAGLTLDTGAYGVAEIDIYLLPGIAPEIAAPHIVVSSAEKDKYDNITNINDENSLYTLLLNSITIFDADKTITKFLEGTTIKGNFKEHTTITYNSSQNAFKNVKNSFQKGRTYECIVEIVDGNKEVSTKYYVTFLDDEISGDMKTVGSRAITEDFYPFHRSDIKRGNNGEIFYAKKANGFYYYINTDNDFLLTPSGRKYPVDACLKVAIRPTPDANGIYEVVPLSKWIVNAECSNLLVSCFENDEVDKQYIEKWEFPYEVAERIRKTYAENDIDIDPNFYENYKNNGYMQQGAKIANIISRGTLAQHIQGTALSWRIEEGTLYIEGDKIALSTVFKIPDYEEDNPAPWASYKFDRVVFDDRIQQIGDYAFYNCTTLAHELELPENCVRIGNSAFEKCVALTGNLILKNVVDVGEYAFKDCVSLNGRFTCGAATQTIRTGAFTNAGFTGGIILTESVVTLGEAAFANCQNISGTLTLPQGLREIPNRAFENCVNMTGDINIPNVVTSIGDRAFAGCIALDGEIKLGGSIKTIGQFAFADCLSLTGDLYLPTNLETIGRFAFRNCASLTSKLKINKNLKKIGHGAFSMCLNIVTVDNTEENKNLKIEPMAFFCNRTVSINYLKREFSRDNPTSFATYDFTVNNRSVSQ